MIFICFVRPISRHISTELESSHISSPKIEHNYNNCFLDVLVRQDGDEGSINFMSLSVLSTVFQLQKDQVLMLQSFKLNYKIDRNRLIKQPQTCSNIYSLLMKI